MNKGPHAGKARTADRLGRHHVHVDGFDAIGVFVQEAAMNLGVRLARVAKQDPALLRRAEARG